MTLDITPNLILQFAAALTLLYGLHIMGYYRKRGPLIAAIAELMWIVTFIPNGMWGGVFLSVALFYIQMKTFFMWHWEGRAW